MKIGKLVLSAAALIALGAPLTFAQNIHQRKVNQQRRIANGVKSGQLTPGDGSSRAPAGQHQPGGTPDAQGGQRPSDGCRPPCAEPPPESRLQEYLREETQRSSRPLRPSGTANAKAPATPPAGAFFVRSGSRISPSFTNTAYSGPRGHFGICRSPDRSARN